MKQSEQEKILSGVFTDENLDRIREASLAQGLRGARQRRHRRVFIASAACGLAMLASSLAVFRPHPQAEPQRSNPAPAQPSVTTVKFINDEQLLSVFSDRAVALIGRAGDQRVVFLDQDKRSQSN